MLNALNAGKKLMKKILINAKLATKVNFAMIVLQAVLNVKM